ncbi:hypothetical protein ABEF92_000045 [Exophiala dermatitidis]|uniref:Uncharacterized protein n=1 Tax=Exophiala dermatitidis (strain ATCC 34100 / CBS 525.76 / NIH/UT8656) TaxID=858893 RepID=H6BV20_EXODN|nr:uncharacterized protein HMPREF1120_03925 [Exophiala dermatitidis NIH/UT8656]EHY55803.1 hypothetical protein HMPREF1120_03925 [Exophiala dermatitidis NIH/UT8656]
MAHAPANPIPHDLFTQEIPPSPTLTNPDMILPYQPDATPGEAPLTSSPVLQMSMPLRPSSAVSHNSSQLDHDAPMEVGIATTVRMSTHAPNVEYTGYEHGAPLSDIWEEETPKSRKSRRTDSPRRSETVSPTPAGRPSLEVRRLSDRSSSSNSSDLGDWENFDTSKIMNERLAADVAKVPDEEIEEVDSKRDSTVAASPEDEMALPNERAERILANARKRLTHMEDHLTKARHSILMSTTSSPSISDHHRPAGGLYRSISAAGASQRRPRQLYPVTRANSSAHTRGGSDVTTTSGLKRLSMVPEIRSASAQEYGRRQESPQVQSSPSIRVEGNSPASIRSFNSPLRVLREEQGTPSTTKTSPESSIPRGLGINTLAAISKEDISMVSSSPTTAIARSSSAMSTRSKELKEQMSDLRARITELKGKAQADSIKRRSLQSNRSQSPFTNAQSPEQWYASAPEYTGAGSPLNTNAGQGWSPLRTQKPVEIQITPVTPQAQRIDDVEQPATNESRLLSEVRTDKNTPSLHKAVNLKHIGQDETMSVIQESLYEDAAQELDDGDEPIAASEEEQIYLNEVLEESLQEAEPDLPDLSEQLLSVEAPAARHEDRVDAFDYENMYLHSALGNYTGTGTRSETPSESDASSIITTRMDAHSPAVGDEEDTEEAGVVENVSTDEASTPVQQTFPRSPDRPSQELTPLASPTKPWMKAMRSNSMDSVSTVATFATATEGGGHGEGDGDEENDEMPTEILHWGTSRQGLGFPPPPASPKHEKAPPTWSNTTTPAWNGRLHQGPNRTPHLVHTSVSSVVSNGMPTPPPVQSPGSGGRFPSAHGAAQFHSSSIHLTHLHNSTTDEGAVDHPANTEILMESLVKLVDPDFKIGAAQDQGRSTVTFSDVDKGLVLDLLRAVGGVCNEILRAERSHEVRAVKVLRRRLDEARNLLEGHATE